MEEKFTDKTVLLVDDEETYRKFLKALTEKNLGVKTVEANNPKDAFDYLEKEIPDLVLLDMQMPVMDGISMLKYIRQSPKLKDLSVIPCTALRTKELVAQVAKLRITDFILKTSDANVVLGKIKKALEKTIDNENK